MICVVLSLLPHGEAILFVDMQFFAALLTIKMPEIELVES